MEYINNYLKVVHDKYCAIIAEPGFDHESNRKNREKFAPLVNELLKQAEYYIGQCEQQLHDNNELQKTYLTKRADLYDKVTKGKSQLSELDQERLKIIAEIQSLQQEIGEGYNEIDNLKKEIEKRKKDQEYWKTVFWATCWIPFANIGTGVKSKYEDDEYAKRLQRIQKNISDKENRIRELNDRQQEVTKKQRTNSESSSKIADQITAVEGEIANITQKINQAKTEMSIWRNIQQISMMMQAELEFANGKIGVILDNLDHLDEIRVELQGIPVTTKYIQGCVCKGDRLLAGQVLKQNEYLLSENRRFAAIMQSDNNFVVYNSERPLWSSDTYGAQGNGQIVFDSKGLVSLEGANKKWNTKRDGAAVLIMQNDGNLVTYAENNQPVWATDTYTYAAIPSICFQS